MEIHEAIDIDFWIKIEGFRNKPYILPPDRFPKAGITLGYGVDLGQWDRRNLYRALSEWLPEERVKELLDKVTPFLGKRGLEASEVLSQAQKVITPVDVVELSTAMLRYFLSVLENSVPNFWELDRRVRTVIALTVWHRGFGVLERQTGFGAFLRYLMNNQIDKAKSVLRKLKNLDGRFANRHKQTLEYLA